jgi:ribose 1,5-bisphosphokinase
VVGPSGVGKDSVMDGLAAADPSLGLVRRVITRPAGAGGEGFDALDDARFDAAVADRTFALQWGAHGLRYGIPRARLAPLTGGRDLLVNLSRRVLVEAQGLPDIPALHVILLSAAPEVLAARLAGRGRESAADIARRLERAGMELPPGLTAPVHPIDNSGPLAQTVAACRAALAATVPAQEVR